MNIKGIAVLAAALSLPSFVLAGSPLAGKNLSADEQGLLKIMDSELTAELVTLAAKVKGWQDNLAAFKRLIEQKGQELTSFDPAKVLKDLEKEVKDEVQAEVAKLVFDIAEELKQRAAKAVELEKYLKVKEKIEPLLQKAEQTWKSLPFDPQKSFAKNEAEFRAQAKQRVLTAAAAQLTKLYDSEIFQLVEKLKNPAEYAKTFVDQELKNLIQSSRPYEIGDVKIKLIQQDFKKSVFSTEANLGVLIQYQEPIELKVTGVYFEYQPGKLPVPKFDKVEAKGPDLESLATNTALTKLGDVIPDLGMGIKIEQPKFNGAAPDRRGRRYGISFKIKLDVSKLMDFAAGIRFEPKGSVTLYPDAPQVVADEDLELSFKDPNARIDLGTTGLMLHGYSITLNTGDREKMVTLGTAVAPATGKEGVSLNIKVQFGMPFQGFKFEGLMLLADSEPLGEVKGAITKTEVSGQIWIPKPGGNLPLDRIFKAHGEFKFDRTGLDAKADIHVFQIIHRTFQMVMRFDGSGRFFLEDSLTLFGVDVTANLEAEFEKNFKNLKLTANLIVEVDGVPGFDWINASVRAVATQERVDVTAHALGMEFSFHLDNLDDPLLPKLRKELIDRAPQAVRILLEAMGKVDIFNKNSAVRRTLLELDVFSKDSEARNILAQTDAALNPFRKNSLINKGLKFIAPPVVEDAAQSVVDFFTGPFSWEQSLQHPRHFAFHNTVPIWEDTRVLAFRRARYFSDVVIPNTRSPLGYVQDELPENVEDQIVKMALAINDEKIVRKPAPEVRKTLGRRYTKATELRIKMERCVPAPEAEHHVVLPIAIRASGYMVGSMMNKDGEQVRSSGSEMKWGHILLENVKAKDGKNQPNAKIVLPPDLKADYTYLPVADIIRDRLQEIIEHFLPGIAIDGKRRFFEKKLAVKNDSDEAVTVWVQRTTLVQRGDKKEWLWEPGAPGTSTADKLVVPAKTTKLLEGKVELNLPKFAGGPKTVTLPLTAHRVRIWAEGAGGERLLKDKDKDLYLVDEDPKYDNARRYYAKEMETYTYTVRLPKGNRVFSERVVTLKNETDQPLTVLLRYRSHKEGQTAWRSLPKVVVEPGQTLPARGADGLMVRASQLAFSAESESMRFQASKAEPVFTVAETDQHRLYRGDTIGTYVQVFRPPTAKKK